MMFSRSRGRWALVACLAGCGGGPDGGIDGATGGADASPSAIDAAPVIDAPPTWGSMCPTDPPILSGQVFAPNGLDPAPESWVYVPAAVVPITPGVACDTCDNALDPAYVTTQTGIDGRFTLDLSAVPLGVPVQLVARKGRFRKITEISVTCGAATVPVGATTLPGSAAAGDLPRIAVASGNADHLDTLLVELGITSFDCFEGRATMTPNCPAAQATGQRIRVLLTDIAALDAYNLLFISCAPNIWSTYSVADRATIAANVADWVSRGGRLIITDHSYDYLSQTWPDAIVWHGPQRVPPAAWEIGTLAGAGANVGLTPQTGNTFDATIDDANITAWLQLPEIGIAGAPAIQITGWLAPWTVQKALGAMVTRVVHGVVDWDYAGSGRTAEDLPLTSQFVVGGCGRVIYSSYHTLSSIGGTTLTAQERILEYLVLDVASCLIP